MLIEDERERQRIRFVAESGFTATRWQALPSDASPRRYFRLQSEQGGTCLLMDVAPPAADLPPYVAVAKHLNTLGLSAPQVMARDFERGFALIEDFGGATYTRCLIEGRDEKALYEQAIDTLVALHEHPDALSIDCPPYDESRLLTETALLPDWFAPALCEASALAQFRQRHQALWQVALAPVQGARDALVLRDFHVDNLMLLPDRDGVAACGLLDFQDALIGSAAYDVMSLTQDARRDLSDGLEAHLLQRYLSLRNSVPADVFLQHYHLLAAQRHCKVAGIFMRLYQRDHKPQYLVHIPRVLRLLRRALINAELSELLSLMDEYLGEWGEYQPNANQEP